MSRDKQDINIINVESNSWTKIEGFSSKGLRVKSWYEYIDNNDIYLYKEPKIYTYSDKIFITKEIWTELIACKLGQFIGLDIPDAIPAIVEGRYGILIKNFLQRGKAGMPINDLIEAKEILSRTSVKYPHNLASIRILLTTEGIASEAWENYLKMLIFDCLIGNNDRHDENWGLLIDRTEKNLKLAPIYDNASCLTSGETEERVIQLLNNAQMLEKYINNSRPPNLYRTFFDSKHYKHFEIMEFLLQEDSIFKDIAADMLHCDYLSYTENIVDTIMRLDVPEPYRLTDNRKILILKILDMRKKKLKDLVNVYN